MVPIQIRLVPIWPVSPKLVERSREKASHCKCFHDRKACMVPKTHSLFNTISRRNTKNPTKLSNSQVDEVPLFEELEDEKYKKGSHCHHQVKHPSRNRFLRHRVGEGWIIPSVKPVLDLNLILYNHLCDDNHNCSQQPIQVIPILAALLHMLEPPKLHV